MAWAGILARMEENRIAYRVLVGKPGGKSTTPRHEDVRARKSIDSRPCGFTSRETASSTQRIWQWVGPRARLDDMDKRKKSLASDRESNPDSSVLNPVAWLLQRLRDPAPKFI
jgi:hypothetical protein